jgi:hypothetical protein
VLHLLVEFKYDNISELIIKGKNVKWKSFSPIYDITDEAGLVIELGETLLEVTSHCESYGYLSALVMKLKFIENKCL